MGIYDEYYSEEAETPMGSEENSESDGSSESRSRSSSPSPSKRKDKKRKRDRDERHAKRKRRRNERNRVEGKDELCGLFMQGKCPKVHSDLLMLSSNITLFYRLPKSVFIHMMPIHLKFGSFVSFICLTDVPRETSAFIYTKDFHANSSTLVENVLTLPRVANLVMIHSMIPQEHCCSR